MGNDDAGKDQEQAQRAPGFGIVGVGSSAGGLDALQALLGALPADTGLSFVLVPHLDPSHTSLMSQLLAAHAKMPVQELRRDQPAAPDHIFVIPPGHLLTIEHGVLRLARVPAEGGSALRREAAIDTFLRSLAVDQQQRAIGIVLSGTGSQGTLGLRHVKDEGGMTLVQDPATAQFDAMPRSAIAAGVADHVLSPQAIAAELTRYAGHAASQGLWRPHPEDGSDSQHLTAILALLRARTKYDFSTYRKNMLLRRVRRRMGLCHLTEMPAYQARLRAEPEELGLLFRDLLIGVTSFFRDPEAFDLLYQRVLEPMVRARAHHPTADEPVRVWVPGCASGEEAYSIAILLFEAFEQYNALPDMQVFATDLDEQALEVARQGVYPKGIATDITEERLRRFFTAEQEDAYRVEKRLREAVVFAPQNLISDAPFSRLDLISCRNLLIYLEPQVQQRIIGLFHFALKPGGYLLLGPSESVGQQSMLFETLSKKWRLFQRVGAPRQHNLLLSAPAPPGPVMKATASEFRDMPDLDLAAAAQRMLLTEYGAAAVLINRRYEILYLFGPTVNYLELPVGRPTLDLTAMVRQGLRTRVRAACHRALSEQAAITVDDARVARDGGSARVRMRVTRLRETSGDEPLLLVSFVDIDEGARPSAEPAEASGAAQEPDIAAGVALAQQLERELRATREDLQTTIEELESANEELKASNEEAMSMNEELQSANEELETSKEELQSVNEELSTVNSQLEGKVEELEQSNNDISNLLASTEIATVFLDTGMRVKRFTPRAAELLNLRATDVGRPLRDLSPNVRDAALVSDAMQVLDRLAPREQDIEGDGDTRYLRRIQPYRTQDHRIEGVVISFIDITERTRAEKVIRASEARYRMLFERSPMCLLEQDWSRVRACLAEESNQSGGALAEWVRANPRAAANCRNRMRVQTLNRSAMRLAGFAEQDATPTAAEQSFPLEPVESFLALLDDLLRGRPSVQELVIRTRSGETIPVLAHMVPVSGHRDTLARVLVAVIDISARKAMEQTLADREQRLSAVLNTVADGIVSIDSDGRITDANAAAERLLGSGTSTISGQPLARFLSPGPTWSPGDDVLTVVRAAAAGSRRPRMCEGMRADGSRFPAEVSIAEIDHLGIFVLLLRDISQRRALEREVIESSAREQQRIGQDIHDGLGQQLAAAGMMAAALAKKLGRAERPEAADATALEQHLQQAMQEARDVVRGLAPVGIGSDGLVKALGTLAQQVARSSGVACELSAEDDLAFIEAPTAATHLYRIAQEAVGNALRHGAPTRIDIDLRRAGPRLRLTVRDDGTWSRAEPGSSGGHGLRIMAYRAGILGGSVSVGPADGGGTLMECDIPYPPQPAQT